MSRAGGGKKRGKEGKDRKKASREEGHINFGITLESCGGRKGGRKEGRKRAGRKEGSKE